jgi:hypothetical protein
MICGNCSRTEVWKPLGRAIAFIKNPVLTAKKTQYFYITGINWLTLFKEIIAVFSENHATYIGPKYTVGKMQLLIIKAGGVV